MEDIDLFIPGIVARRIEDIFFLTRERTERTLIAVQFYQIVGTRIGKERSGLLQGYMSLIYFMNSLSPDGPIGQMSQGVIPSLGEIFGIHNQIARQQRT